MGKVLARQLDLILREELRAEIRRLEHHVLDMGDINARLYDRIREALTILTVPMEPDEAANRAAIKVLRRALRQPRGKY